MDVPPDLDEKSGSAESENGSDNSYVQVSREDAQNLMDSPVPQTDSPQLISGSGMSPEEELEEKDTTVYEDTRQEPVEDATSSTKPMTEDPFYMESHDPEEEKEEEEEVTPPPLEDTPTSSSGVENVPAAGGRLVPPKPTGYLSFLGYLHPAILYIIYWEELKLSAVVLGVDIVILLTLTLNTFLHTIILLLLSFLVVSLTYIVTKIAIDSFYNRSARNPFSEYLNHSIALPEERIMELTQYLVKKFSWLFNVLVRLLLFDNIKQSLKFGVFLWLASFVTNCVNILTAMFLVTILLFAAPPLYSKYQTSIDCTIKKCMCSACEAIEKVKGYVPFLKKSKVD